MTYSQKLRDPRWQKKRLEILQRDNWTCQSCQSTTKNLQVHHLVYRKIDPWDYADTCYQTLCEDCHEIRQELTDKIVDAIRLKIKNLSTDELHKMAIKQMAISMTNDEAFDNYMAQSIEEASEITKAGEGVLNYGLWSDVIMDLCSVQIHGRGEPNVKSRTASVLKMAVEKLEANSNGK